MDVRGLDIPSQKKWPQPCSGQIEIGQRRGVCAAYRVNGERAGSEKFDVRGCDELRGI